MEHPQLTTVKGRLSYLVSGGRLTKDSWSGNSYITFSLEGLLVRVMLLEEDVLSFPLELMSHGSNWKPYLGAPFYHRKLASRSDETTED